MAAQAINLRSLKIIANQSSRSTLTKYIQGVPTPREILKETLRFIWQENTTNLLLSNERKSHHKACSTIINCR